VKTIEICLRTGKNRLGSASLRSRTGQGELT
jgi:hypothetical protein